MDARLAFISDKVCSRNTYGCKPYDRMTPSHLQVAEAFSTPASSAEAAVL